MGFVVLEMANLTLDAGISSTLNSCHKFSRGNNSNRYCTAVILFRLLREDTIGTPVVLVAEGEIDF